MNEDSQLILLNRTTFYLNNLNFILSLNNLLHSNCFRKK